MLTKEQQIKIAEGLTAKYPDIAEETMREIGSLLFTVSALDVSSDADYLIEVAGDEAKDDAVRGAASYCLNVISGVEV